MSAVRTGRVGKHVRGHRMKSASGLRMMAIMQDRNSEEVPKEFLETGRTGRRNAMPDILHPQGAEVTTADLPSRLQQLVTTDISYELSQCPSDLRHPVRAPEENQITSQEFHKTGRTGRRNALADILRPDESGAGTSNINTDMDNPQPCSSKTDLDTKKCDDASKKDSCS